MWSSLLLAASVGMILSGVAMLWFTVRRRAERHFLFMAAGSFIGGLAWFLPSEAAGAGFWVVSAACSLIGATLIAVTTWRSAKTRQAR